MSRRSVAKENFFKEFGEYKISGLERDLKRISKDYWKLKEAKRDRKKKRW